MIKFLLWCILLVLCWPLAILALIFYPIIWLLLLPFRILGIAVDGVLQLVSQAEADVKPSGGRVLLRYSGTEPKARFLIEGRDSAVLEKWTQKIAEAIRKQVGA